MLACGIRADFLEHPSRCDHLETVFARRPASSCCSPATRNQLAAVLFHEHQPSRAPDLVRGHSASPCGDWQVRGADMRGSFAPPPRGGDGSGSQRWPIVIGRSYGNCKQRRLLLETTRVATVFCENRQWRWREREGDRTNFAKHKPTIATPIRVAPPRRPVRGEIWKKYSIDLEKLFLSCSGSLALVYSPFNLFSQC